jgi:hypothetical protein
MNKKIILSLVLSIVIFGCVSVSAIPLGGHSFYRTDKPVATFFSRDQIPQEYVEIAYLNAETGDGDFVRDEKMIAGLIEKALAIGADAIIIESNDSRSEGGYYGNGIWATSTSKSFKCISIRYKEN